MSTGPLAFVISPQPWAGFHVSKHHYAIALADCGWRVVFIDPPTDLGSAGRIEMHATDIPGITSLRYQTFFPYKLKFRARWLFDRLMRRQARRLVTKVGKPDLVWDFDNAYQFRDLRPFSAKTTLFHLVDDVSSPNMGTKHADHLFYLHPSFATHAGGVVHPDHHVGHGLGRAHETAARNTDFGTPNPDQPHIGFVGNLAAAWIDWDAIEIMLTRHPQARFTFWGPHPAPDAANTALTQIVARPNAFLPGLTAPAQILTQASSVDVWLVPFIADKLLGGPLNSHKILEYLSTGKVVVMSWLDAYSGNPLVHMLPDRHSTALAEVLDQVLANLSTANNLQSMEERRAYAMARTYDQHLAHILRVAKIDIQDLHSNAA
ncbi:hypothetical protein TRL7639_04546 [Falsiruegeria litorea R37]|uniref:Glycosyl transferases group 1 n=1 Tax=Falsiruegeria litorea R37 TaxID=1200284 RepID=A0A1Y5TVT2_9RHOB|nr:hypothetical protein [Falsiruegeria litorea]SLN74538.1 hypothetical protein TRL7639_04546 [Falsiruegeria litorea R37]